MESPNKTFDSLLVLQYQSGNKKALVLLVKRWHARFCKHAFWYTNDIDTSKDIAQDSWGKICNNIYQLKETNSFGSWALTIVTRTALDWLNNQKKELRNRKLYSNQYEGINEPEQNENADTTPIIAALNKAVKALGKKHQIVMHLFYIEEYSIKQIAQILQITQGTVKSRLFTAREKLKLIVKNQKL
ncbi:RNA polymerase sigma factor [Aquimarina brevivitae]|uniref:RNA polymerase sigma-70 factor (ECF subfamily) n=1 Tax=Aquimarina brevivitae TaxID=323412 RepID=A0A4Q7NTD8_9FLAO|nr:sigma-70 family RNA polymerase sigma factor [Aquimarina brevivitae]RZS90433.1 RNA polymerase sigma-70 factor (ECF subfamily) [Aquimarina brevivitae]